MIQLKLTLTNVVEPVQAIWERSDPAHREALTQRLAFLIAKACAAPTIVKGTSDDE